MNGPEPVTRPADLESEPLLELFFSQSLEGFFFMMLDEPVEWGDDVNKDEVLDYVFDHQRMTKVNSAIVTQFNASSPDELLGRTPAQFFAHDLPAAKARWRQFFDQGRFHSETDERRLDGTPVRIEGDYMVIRDSQGRIAGHFGIQRDVTEKYQAAETVRASRQELRALAARLHYVREEERTVIAREIHDELGQALAALKANLNVNRLEWDARRIDCLQLVDDAIANVRELSQLLRPVILDDFGLDASLRWLTDRFGERTIQLRMAGSR